MHRHLYKKVTDEDAEAYRTDPAYQTKLTEHNIMRIAELSPSLLSALPQLCSQEEIQVRRWGCNLATDVGCRRTARCKPFCVAEAKLSTGLWTKTLEQQRLLRSVACAALRHA